MKCRQDCSKVWLRRRFFVFLGFFKCSYEREYSQRHLEESWAGRGSSSLRAASRVHQAICGEGGSKRGREESGNKGIRDSRPRDTLTKLQFYRNKKLGKRHPWARDALARGWGAALRGARMPAWNSVTATCWGIPEGSLHFGRLIGTTVSQLAWVSFGPDKLLHLTDMETETWIILVNFSLWEGEKCQRTRSRGSSAFLGGRSLMSCPMLATWGLCLLTGLASAQVVEGNLLGPVWVWTHCSLDTEAASGLPPGITSTRLYFHESQMPLASRRNTHGPPACVEGCFEESLEAVLPEMDSREQSGLSSYRRQMSPDFLGRQSRT